MCIKSFANSWCTSYRFHEAERLPCIFGCTRCKDEFAHYLTCDPLDTVVTSSLCLPALALSTSPLPNLGFFGQRRNNIIKIVIKFKVYHALRNEYSSLIDGAIRKDDFNDLLVQAWRLAIVFAGELS